jgi:hypothetical protein
MAPRDGPFLILHFLKGWLFALVFGRKTERDPLALQGNLHADSFKTLDLIPGRAAAMAIIQMQSCPYFIIPCFAETRGRNVDAPCHLKYAYFAADVFCASCSQILDHRGPF